MPTTNFTSDNLRKLLRVNFFNFSEVNMMVFGIRGAVPLGTDSDDFSFGHQILDKVIDYKQAACTIGIWKPALNVFSLFPASTVPNISYIKKHIEKKAKANEMMSGYYNFFEKGFHNPSPENAHEALRLATNIALRRSTNDLKFDNNDPIEVGNPGDNIHAAYCDDINGVYSSAGCQVIIGQPKCKSRGPNSQHSGHWRKFHNIIYNEPNQSKFDYALFRFADAAIVSSQGSNLMQARLRFGSKGNIVLKLQEKLAEKGFFTTNKDGEFGRNTLEAVIAYQTKTFGLKSADGVVGGGTAGALGLVLPMV